MGKFGPWPPPNGGAGGPGSVFDLKLSYGHGVPGVDDQLPDAEGGYEFWLSGTDGADIIQLGQVREWVTVEDLAFESLVVRVDLCNLIPIDPATIGRVVVTVNGADTIVTTVLVNGTDYTLSTGGAVAIPAGSRVGIAVTIDGAMDVGSSLRLEARLIAAPTVVTITPLAPPPGMKFWFKADAGLTLSPSSTVGPDVLGWADQSANHFDAFFGSMPLGSRKLQYNPTSTNALPGLTGSQGLLAQGVASGTTIYAGGTARTVFAVVRFGGTGAFGSLGGYVFTFRRSAPEFACGVFTKGPPDPPGHQLWYTDFNAPTNIEAVTPVDYSGQALLLRWQTDVAGTHLTPYKGSLAIPVIANVLGGESGNAGFIIGNLINDDGHAVFEGDLNEIIGYDGGADASRDAQVTAYLAQKWAVAP